MFIIAHLLSAASAFADCNVLVDLSKTKISSKAEQEVKQILSSKGYGISFKGTPDMLLHLVDISQGSYTNNDIFYGIDARLLGQSGGTLARGTSVKVSQDEKFVFAGSWIDQSTIEAVENLKECAH